MECEVLLEESPNEIHSMLDMFREYVKVKQIIEDIPIVVQQTAAASVESSELTDSRQFASEKAFQDLKTILDQYQEQPHLLDSHLEELLGLLVALVKEMHLGLADHNSEIFQGAVATKRAVAAQAFKYIYLFTKVRGYKVIVNKLPHEVSDLLPVLEMLEAIADDHDKDFFASYVLLLWISIIVYMPFSIADFDEKKASCSKTSSGVVVRLLQVVRCYLRSPQASRDMAAFLASKLVTRPDLRDQELPSFIEHCLQAIESHSQCGEERLSHFHRAGCLRALGLVWKHGRRQELLPLSSATLRRLLALEELTQGPDSSVRKLMVKLLQRIGLTFLPPRLASWRYQRGQRSLLLNMQTPAMRAPEILHDLQPEAEDDVEVLPEVEDVIDELLTALKDSDTIVRYSSSKGLGRVCGRLSRTMASEVVCAVLGLFTARDTHNTWHGGCLALAELARRGLLLENSLPEVVSVLEKALVYDKLIGQSSVGANIRDAACYLSWSLARAYDPHTLEPYVRRLATGLLIVALFDREIPCRHAAAAAFQEHVGRQGNFSHGIEILTTVDYFSVGIRATAYLKLAPFVASFPEYSIALVDHLVDEKLSHWDAVIRELAAQTLHCLTRYCPEYCSTHILPKLLDMVTGAVLVTRLGAAMALGYVINALVILARQQGQPYQNSVSKAVIDKVSGLCNDLAGRRLLQGLGGSYMRHALSELIRLVTSAKIVLSPCITLEWLAFLEENVFFVEEDVRGAAVRAFEAILAGYFIGPLDEQTRIEDIDNKLCNKQEESLDHHAVLSKSTVSRYLSALNSERESHAQGMALALGVLPRELLVLYGEDVLIGLLKACLITPETVSWAATRRDAINSVTSVVTTMGLIENQGGVSQFQLNHIMQTLQRALEDYTADRRGDVGAWVREAAVVAIQKLLILSTQNSQHCGVSPTPEIVSSTMAGIVRLSVERIDRTRRIAGEAIASIVHHAPKIAYIPFHREIAHDVIPASLCSTVIWGSDKDTFPVFSRLLAFPDYSKQLLIGYCYSLGGISANLAQSASDAIDGFIESLLDKGAIDDVVQFFNLLLSIMDDDSVHDRLALSLLKTLDHFLTATNFFDEAISYDQRLFDELLIRLKRESRGCKDYHKLVSVSSSLSELLRLSPTKASTNSLFNQLLLFLGYQYPKVRAVTAASLLQALQDYGSELVDRNAVISQDGVDVVLQVLEDTPWMEAGLPEARASRNKCCEALALPLPTSVNRKTGSEQQTGITSMHSFADVSQLQLVTLHFAVMFLLQKAQNCVLIAKHCVRMRENISEFVNHVSSMVL